MSLDSFGTFSTEPEPELEEAICNCLYMLLPTLKLEYAAVIWRIDLMNEKREMMAARLDITVNALTVRLHRARWALKRWRPAQCTAIPIVDATRSKPPADSSGTSQLR